MAVPIPSPAAPPSTSTSTDSSVLALISAFTSGLDIFKKLHKRRHRKDSATTSSKRKGGSGSKASVSSSEVARAKSAEEARLSQSLKRGSVSLLDEYHRGYAVQGERFREGDSKAHAALASILLKLNNGLVSIISCFLSGGGHKTAVPAAAHTANSSYLDFERLTLLSESSRFEAIDALSQLALRLASRSSLAGAAVLERCADPQKSNSSTATTSRETLSANSKKTSATSSSSPSSSTRPGRLPAPVQLEGALSTRTIGYSKGADGTGKAQLAYIKARPRPKTASSASGQQSPKRGGGGSSSGSGSGASTPRPGTATTTNSSKDARRAERKQQQQQVDDRYSIVEHYSPPPPPYHSHPYRSPTLGDSKQAHAHSNGGGTSGSKPPPAHLTNTHAAAPPLHEHPYFRHLQSQSQSQQQARASLYTFASDSTKIGEIPRERWVEKTWVGEEEAARLNALEMERRVRGHGSKGKLAGKGRGRDAQGQGGGVGGRFRLWKRRVGVDA